MALNVGTSLGQLPFPTASLGTTTQALPYRQPTPVQDNTPDEWKRYFEELHRYQFEPRSLLDPFRAPPRAPNQSDYDYQKQYGSALNQYSNSGAGMGGIGSTGSAGSNDPTRNPLLRPPDYSAGISAAKAPTFTGGFASSSAALPKLGVPAANAAPAVQQNIAPWTGWGGYQGNDLNYWTPKK